MKNKKSKSSFIYSWKVAPYVFIFPLILSFLVFWVYPLFTTVKMSFQNIQPGQVTWVGLANYTKLLKDKTFFTAIKNSFLYMLLTCALLIPFPMLFACMIDSVLIKIKGFYKSVLYLPALTSVVVAGTIFRLMFSERAGSAMNDLLAMFGHDPIKWLTLKGTSMFAMVLLCCWRWTGVNILYFLSGLKNINPELYEAADIDGASRWQKFIHITLPLLRPTSIYVLTISIYAGLSMFLESFMLWNGNSSPRNVGLTIVGYLYRRGIEKNEMGYGSAVGLALLIIALIINFTQLTLSGTFKKKES